MSVWKNACYRDDTLQRVCALIHENDYQSPFVLSLCDFRIDDPGDFALPGGIVAGNFKEQVIKDPRKLSHFIDKPKVRRSDPNNAVFGKLARKLGACKFGVHGVYRFVADNWAAFNKTESISLEDKNFFSAILNFGYASSLRTAAEAVRKVEHCTKSLEASVVAPYSAIRSIIRLCTRLAGQKYRKDVEFARLKDADFPEATEQVPAFLRHYKIYWWKGLLILVSPATEEGYIFTKDDISRIERLVMGLAWCKFYCREYSDTSEDLNREMVRGLDEILGIVYKSLKNITKDGANNLCRAYDVALWHYIASLSTDVDNRALKQQKDKIRNEKLDTFVDQNVIFAIVSRYKLKEALELLQVYKAFPQPDFDYCGAAARQVALYSNVRPYGVEAETENSGPYENLWKYFKHTVIRAFHKKHGFCPGTISVDAQDKNWHRVYPNISPDKIPYLQVDDIDMGNSFTYAAHGEDIMELVKDKAICPGQVDNISCASELNSADISTKNQLMDILNRAEPVSMLDVNEDTALLYKDVKAEDKPEAKKPKGRWFFEAHTEARLTQSEYEMSVAEYAKHTAGCMAGKSTKDKITAMNYITQLPKLGARYFTRPFFISFDLDKFSPSLTAETHAISDKLFANAFGQPHIENAGSIYTDGNIHYIKRKVHHKFKKMGRDFEGFSGRKNTIYHCAVMGYCVRRLREKKLIGAGGRFLSLIDDGLLRVEIPVDKYKESVEEILEVIEDVYRMANLYISWDKTFISEHFCVFLNEFYYDGTPITPGIRAFLKMTNRSDDYCPSILSDIAMLDSTARGAITAGSAPGAVYGAFAFHTLDIIKKWNRNNAVPSTRLALALFAPVGLGGFGLSSVGNLSGSIGGPTFVESIGNLRAIAVRFKELVDPINRMVNCQMRPISPEEKLRAPLAVRRDGRTLKATRARQVIEKRLRAIVDTPVIRALLGDVSVRADDSMPSLVTYRAQVPIEVLQAIHSSSLDAAFTNLAAKFLRARTAYRLVPVKSLFRAAIANITEAACLISEWA